MDRYSQDRLHRPGADGYGSFNSIHFIKGGSLSSPLSPAPPACHLQLFTNLSSSCYCSGFRSNPFDGLAFSSHYPYLFWDPLRPSQAWPHLQSGGCALLGPFVLVHTRTCTAAMQPNLCCLLHCLPALPAHLLCAFALWRSFPLGIPHTHMVSFSVI